MKNLVLTILILVIFVSPGYSIKNQYVDLLWDFEDGSIGEWYIGDGVDYSIENGRLHLEKEEIEKDGEILLFGIEFLEEKYRIYGKIPENDKRFRFWHQDYGKKNKYRVEITIYDEKDYLRQDFKTAVYTYVSFYYGTDEISNIWEEFQPLERGIYCLKRIDFYMTDLYAPIDTYIDNIEVLDLTWLNPENPDYTELYVSFSTDNKKSWMVYDDEDEVEMKILFYYGHESQNVDLYIVFYDGTDLFFFPDWTKNVQKVGLYLPQFTEIRQWLYICTYRAGDLPLRVGENQYTIGIAPSGTMDFLNELNVQSLWKE